MKREESLAMIRTLSDAFGPSGFEDEPCALGASYAAPFCDAREDNFRNLYLTPKNNRGDRPMLLIDAHGDECGFMIHSIRDNGALRFITLGHFPVSCLPGSRVLVRNRWGEYLPGVIASKPPHFLPNFQESGLPAMQDLVIDVGATSRQEAEEVFGMAMGEPAVPDVRCTYDEKRDLLIGKAFDCRIGCAAVVETLERLAGEDLAIDCTGTFSAQEEPGMRGISVVRNAVRPQVAICFEGCPADDTFMEPYAVQAAIKRGPMLRFVDKSMITHPRFIRFALDVARREGIPVQTSVREGGGTNGAHLHNEYLGIPTIVISIPVRYTHSSHGIAGYEDYENAVRLAVAVTKALTPEVLAGF